MSSATSWAQAPQTQHLRASNQALASRWARNSALHSFHPQSNPVSWERNLPHCADKETETTQLVHGATKSGAQGVWAQLPGGFWLSLTPPQAESPSDAAETDSCTQECTSWGLALWF